MVDWNFFAMKILEMENFRKKLQPINPLKFFAIMFFAIVNMRKNSSLQYSIDKYCILYKETRFHIGSCPHLTFAVGVVVQRCQTVVNQGQSGHM